VPLFLVDFLVDFLVEKLTNSANKKRGKGRKNFRISVSRKSPITYRIATASLSSLVASGAIIIQAKLYKTPLLKKILPIYTISCKKNLHSPNIYPTFAPRMIEKCAAQEQQKVAG
jgi:hypothetical protein